MLASPLRAMNWDYEFKVISWGKNVNFVKLAHGFCLWLAYAFGVQFQVDQPECARQQKDQGQP
jgi:hypothetical protein